MFWLLQLSNGASRGGKGGFLQESGAGEKLLDVKKEVESHNGYDSQAYQTEPKRVGRAKSLCLFLQLGIPRAHDPSGKKIYVYSKNKEERLKKQSNVFHLIPV
jgi:hypothetical protein